MRLVNKVFLMCIVVVLSTTYTAAQNKEASMIAGFTATQIHGDGIGGYNKAGLEFGISVQSPISEKVFFQPELLYFQKGSATSSNQFPPFKIKLNYLEVPLMFGRNIGEYFQVQGGPSVGYLISGDAGISEVSSLYRKIDTSLMLGGSYRFLENVSLKIRYAISVVSIRKVGNSVNDTASFLLVFHI